MVSDWTAVGCLVLFSIAQDQHSCHVRPRVQVLQFPKSHSIQTAPDTIIKPSSPMPSSPLSEATSGNNSSELSNTAQSTESTQEPKPTLFQSLKHLS